MLIHIRNTCSRVVIANTPSVLYSLFTFCIDTESEIWPHMADASGVNVVDAGRYIGACL